MTKDKALLSAYIKWGNFRDLYLTDECLFSIQTDTRVEVYADLDKVQHFGSIKPSHDGWKFEGSNITYSVAHLLEMFEPVRFIIELVVRVLNEYGLDYIVNRKYEE